MRPVLGLLALALLAYGTLALVGIVMSLLFTSSIAQMLFFAGVGSISLGALLLSGGRNEAEENVYERAYVTGGGSSGDVRVWPQLKSQPLEEGERLAVPCGMHSIQSLERGTPWLTSITVGIVMVVAGVATMVSAFL